MRVLVLAFGLCSTPVFAQALSAESSKIAVEFSKIAVEKLEQCLVASADKAKQKKVSPDTFKLILDGACQDEETTARGAFSQMLTNSIPAAIRDEGTELRKLKYLRGFDAEVENRKAKMISEYALSD